MFLIVRVDARSAVTELRVIKIRLLIFVLLSIFLSVLDVVDVDFIDLWRSISVLLVFRTTWTHSLDCFWSCCLTCCCCCCCYCCYYRSYVLTSSIYFDVMSLILLRVLSFLFWFSRTSCSVSCTLHSCSANVFCISIRSWTYLLSLAFSTSILSRSIYLFIYFSLLAWNR